MKNKINLVIVLMSLCTVLLLGLQLFWNYQSYHSNVRVFTSDVNDALDKAVNLQMDMKRDAFAAQYKKWLADTSLVEISCKYSDTLKETVFSVKDKYSRDHRLPFSFGINTFKQKLRHITPQAKTFFINNFVENILHGDLVSGSAYYYTEKLGSLMADAFKHDKPDTAQLIALYKRELAKRDIDNEFHLHLGIYTFKGFSAPNVPVSGLSYGTRIYKSGFAYPMAAVSAYFPHPNLVFLQKMKWVLLSSLVLIGITIACFTYTVNTMLSQNKLARLKDDFINNMTHELKTPVATIGIAAEAIQSFKVNPNTAEEYLGIIRHQAGNLGTLIDQMLKSLVSENAAIRLNLQRLPLNVLVLDCINQYQPQFNAAGAHITFNPSPELYINGDATHLNHVIANLLDNAIKYGNEKPDIKITTDIDADCAVLIIANNGETIPAEYLDKIFERFFRVPTGNRHNVKGYGLGLSYVLDVLNRHGCKITVSSCDDITTFTIYLPLL